ncbi:MAG: PQQ-dependent sugar dehydrogenase [Bdellovibrionota bacterium]
MPSGIGGAGQGALESASCEFVEQGFGTTGTTSLQVETLASGLEVPWGMAFLPNRDLLFTERPGRVRIIRSNALQPTPVVQINAYASGEAGLLGITIDPDFDLNRFFYLYYTLQKASGLVNRVERYSLSIDSRSASADRVIFDDIPGNTTHNGGRLKFGPDGMLYIGTGDASSPALAQQNNSSAGKILRLLPDGRIPSDNPSSGSPAFVSGLRNTQGFDWLNSKTLFVADHGPTGEFGRRGSDEINLANAGDNLGWPNTWRCDATSQMTAPLLTWSQATPPGAMVLYRGNAIPDWQGNLIVTTLGSKHLHRIILETQTDSVRIAGHEVYLEGDPPRGFGRLRDVVNGPDGFLYVTTSNCDGRGTCPAEKDRILKLNLNIR